MMRSEVAENARPDDDRRGDPPTLALTGSFELATDAGRLTMPHSAERLLACVALARGPIDRTRASGLLWADTTADRAASNLRTALWRVHSVSPGLIVVAGNRLRLDPGVRVDLHRFHDLARDLLHTPDDDTLARVVELAAPIELLPDWDDEWIVADRERLRLVRLEALEGAAEAFYERGRLSAAVLVAQTAVDSEPLRESSRRLVVAAQLGRGNVAEAVRCYRQYRRLLRLEFGADPSPAMEALLRPWRPDVACR